MFQGLPENQKENISKLSLIKLPVKASSEKAWLLYEVPLTNRMMHMHERPVHHYIQ